MINVEQLLPNPNLPNYNQELDIALRGILRQFAQEINRYSGSTWNGLHPVLGSYHLWVDETGDLRIKSSQPESDTDGDIVGAQS